MKRMFSSKESRDSKNQQKLDELMEQYNLEGLSQEDKEAAKAITQMLWGAGLIRLGSRPADSANIGMLQALVEQNWLIIKLLNELNEKLDK